MNERKYYYVDFAEPLANGCYLPLRTEKGAVHFLNHEAKIISGYDKFIDQYPQVKLEPLEFLYQCLRSVNMMNPKLIKDLTDFGWRGALWGSWLALITPHNNRYFIPELEKVCDIYPHNDWLIKLALAHCQNTKLKHEVMPLADEFRAFLARMPKIEMPLRKWPSPIQLKLYEFRRFRLKHIYRTKGTDAALQFMSKCKKYDWELSYTEWRKKTSK